MSNAHDQIESLVGLAPLKVWSVVVTIMGDLCRTPEDRIPGRVLDALVSRMGITNQALRTALHRLKRDGWIESARDGRVSTYALTAVGRERTEAVRPVIYADAPPPPVPVFVLNGDPAMSAADFAETLGADDILLSGRTALSTDPDPAARALVTTLDPDDLPFWVRETVADVNLRTEYATLAAHAPSAPGADVLETTVIRLLTLHNWRRLRLRHGDLPELVLGEWEGTKARAAVMATLAASPKPRIGDLD